MSPERTRAKHSPANPGNKRGSFEIALPVRLGIAAVLLIVSALINMPVLIRMIILILSVVIAGYDIFLAAVDYIAEKQYFSTELVLVFSAVLGFVVGYGAEVAVMVLLYQIAKLVLDYTRKRSIKSAKALLQYQNEDIQNRIEEIISAEHAGETHLQKTIEDSARFVLRFVMILALVYAVVMPFVTGISFQVSIHRALMILLISSPMSVAVSFPIVGITALCDCARKGVLFNGTDTMENTTKVNVALFDKAGVFSEDTPHLIGLQSDVLDKRTFLNFLAHAVYYSDQPFATAISDYYTDEYHLDLISNFVEIPGSGVSVEIGSAPVILASKNYFEAEGIEIPDRSQQDGIAYHMTIAGRYVGRAVVSADINQEAEGLVDAMVRAGISRNILLTEDGSELSQATADSLHFSEVIGECDLDRKLRLISDISQDGQNNTAFIYANGIEGHSAADLDIRVSRKGKYADALVLPESYLNIPSGIETCRRMLELISENAIFVFLMKAVLIFLSFLGYSNLWFVVFMDAVVALATILNASRVSSPSLLKRKGSENSQ